MVVTQDALRYGFSRVSPLENYLGADHLKNNEQKVFKVILQISIAFPLSSLWPFVTCQPFHGPSPHPHLSVICSVSYFVLIIGVVD